MMQKQYTAIVSAERTPQLVLFPQVAIPALQGLKILGHRKDCLTERWLRRCWITLIRIKSWAEESYISRFSSRLRTL